VSALYRCFLLSSPLFATVLAGFLVARLRHWRRSWTALATKLVFAFILPAMLFNMMSDLSALPALDARLLLAFFGGCLIVFMIGRLVGQRWFGLDGVGQSVFALGGVFSNNVLLGLPMAKSALGKPALPAVGLIIVFNSLTLWTLVSVSVEWARQGSLTAAGLAKTAIGVLTNPIVAAIILGLLFGVSGLRLPHPAAVVLGGVSRIAAPAALLVLGMGLAEYGLASAWQQSAAICALKLVVQPAVVAALGVALGLPLLELKVVVLMASMSVGANVYLMAVQFKALEGAIANSLLLSTALAALSTPILLAALQTLG
jgi:predicted permease